ncbi:ASCH domain-containing protein [Curtobacterium sp. VKM Ac-1393]|nr:ASCH domain-containing protein [Curtobacterium sp. VKM Ac-1393]
MPQTIHFHRKHHDAVQRGEKVTTVRWQEDVRPGPAVFVFDEHPTARPLDGAVTEVTNHPLADLTPAAAHQPAGTDMVEFATQLRANYYPDMPDDAVVQVAVIALDATQRG